MKVKQASMIQGGKTTLVVNVDMQNTQAERKKYRKWLEGYMPPVYPVVIYQLGVTFQFEDVHAFANYRNFECKQKY